MTDSNDIASTEKDARSPRFAEPSTHEAETRSTFIKPDSGRYQDSAEISQTTSPVKLQEIVDEAEATTRVADEDSDPRTNEADFNRRGSSAEPAGSGMPPPETAYLTEKEVVAGKSPNSSREERIRSTFLEIPSYGEVELGRPVQSPMSVELQRRLSSIERSASVENRRSTDMSGPSKPVRSSFSTEFSDDDSQADAQEASVIFQAARQARLKRPSLVSHPAAGGSGIQLANLAKFIRAGEIQSVGGDVVNQVSNLQELNEDLVLDAKLGFDPRIDLLGPRTLPKDPHLTTLSSPAEHMTLQDALRLDPIDVGALPKRSATVPRSLGSKRKARFAPLSITSTGAGRFRRDSIVTTPYPKLDSEAKETEQQRRRSGSRSPKQVEFSLTISARNRNSTISVPQFGSPEPKATAWWNVKEADDQKLVELAKAEYASIQGRLRHFCGAKTAKSVRVRFVRSNKSEHFREPDSPLIGGRCNSYAESDFFSLWVHPGQGRGKRDWLDVLTNHSKIYGASRTFVLEIIEGFDAMRILVAFATVTALSLVAMFLWLFVGVGGTKGGSAGRFVDGQGHEYADAGLTGLTAGSPTAAFLFAIWILCLGWTGVGAWMFVS